MSFTPKTTLEKILCGVTATAKTRLEKAFAAAMLRLSNDPVAVTGTIGKNESQKTTITLNKTAAELYAAISSGKTAHVTYSTGENASTEMGCTCTGAKNTSGETVTYGFCMSDYSGTQYTASSLAGSDTVVLTAA